MLRGVHEIFRRLHRSPMITLAAINGHCYGGGAELALFCDFVLAGRSANIGFPEITLGCLPPVASLILQKKCGSALATDLVLAGRTLTGAEAAASGLATRLLPGGKKFGPALDQCIRQITGHSAAAQRHARAALRLSCRYHESFEERLGRIEALYLNQLMKTRDAREGLAAFMEKRKPRWLDA
jgi:cyclohexa-1,5-dienecarbonyl-CoA hydratase